MPAFTGNGSTVGGLAFAQGNGGLTNALRLRSSALLLNSYVSLDLDRFHEHLAKRLAFDENAFT